MRSFAVAALTLALAAGSPASSQQVLDAASGLASCSTTSVQPRILTVCFYEASTSASRAARHLVGFETGTNVDVETAPAFADAAMAVSQDLWRMTERAAGRAALTQITRVVFDIGVAPAARFSDGVLTITIVPSLGAAGRPSFDEIDRAVQTAPQIG